MGSFRSPIASSGTPPCGVDKTGSTRLLSKRYEAESFLHLELSLQIPKSRLPSWPIIRVAHHRRWW